MTNAEKASDIFATTFATTPEITSATPPLAKRRSSPRVAPVDADHEAWLAKYTPVEQAIIEAQEKRLVAKFRRKYDMARRFGEICELSDGAAVRWRSDGFFAGEEKWLASIGSLGYWEYLDYVGKSATRRINRMRSSLVRPLYYEAENRRRRAMAAERRKIRERRTVNACPTKEAILEAWKDRKTSHEAAIRFGSLLEDLECYVDNSLKFDEEGAIIGRQGGIKLWLKENIPALALVYSSVMRYKAAAKKLRQIAGLADPVPAAAMVETTSAAAKLKMTSAQAAAMEGTTSAPTAALGGTKCDYDAENRVAGDGGCRETAKGGEGRNGGFAEELKEGIVEAAAKRDYDAENEPAVEVVRAMAIWAEVEKTAGKSVTALFERLDDLTDPGRIEDANMLEGWRRKYENEITLRNKRRWWKLLTRRKTA